jgi:hypothetical protein
MGTDEMSVVLVEAKQLLLKLYKALGWLWTWGSFLEIDPDTNIKLSREQEKFSEMLFEQQNSC